MVTGPLFPWFDLLMPQFQSSAPIKLRPFPPLWIPFPRSNRSMLNMVYIAYSSDSPNSARPGLELRYSFLYGLSAGDSIIQHKFSPILILRLSPKITIHIIPNPDQFPIQASQGGIQNEISNIPLNSPLHGHISYNKRWHNI